jgi:protein translocase SecG subunit
MSILHIITGLRFAVCGLIVIFLVLAQQPNTDMGVLGGSSAYRAMQQRSIDSRIAKTTKNVAIVFFILGIVCGMVNLFTK